MGRKEIWESITHLDSIEREVRRDLANCNIYNSSLKERQYLEKKIDRVHDEKRYYERKLKEDC